MFERIKLTFLDKDGKSMRSPRSVRLVLLCLFSAGLLVILLALLPFLILRLALQLALLSWRSA